MLFYLSSMCLNALICMVVMFLFFFASKLFFWENLSSSAFECGYTPWYFSRFSFSIHFYLVALIFLFLDLELCILFPLLNMSFSTIEVLFSMAFLVSILVIGLMMEWVDGKLDWVF